MHNSLIAAKLFKQCKQCSMSGRSNVSSVSSERGATSIFDGIFIIIFMIVILSAQKLSMAHIRAGISWHRTPPHLEQNSPTAPLKWTRQSITIVTIVIVTVIEIVIRTRPGVNCAEVCNPQATTV